MLKKIKQKIVPIFLGLLVVAGTYWFEVTPISSVDLISKRLNSMVYDIRMRIDLAQKNEKNPSTVAIVDIDEKSLATHGRWPWPRNKMAMLLEKLRNHGVIVIAFDIIFSEPERNVVQRILQNESTSDKIAPGTKLELEKLQSYFDNDKIFSETIEGDDVVLGFVLTSNPHDHIGMLPKPILELTKEQAENTLLNKMPGHITDIELLQKSAKGAGFVTSLTDNDGIIRHYPIVLQHGDSIYPSLALSTAMEYLLINELGFDFAELADKSLVLENILLGNKPVPTDEKGQVLIPYQGLSGTYEYFSASDILTDKVPAGALRNKIVFIGTSAIGLGDLHATPFESNFPGVEIHATVADILLSGTFPTEPDWDFGALLFMILFFGTLFALFAPFLSVAWALFTPMILIAVLVYFNSWLWQYHEIYLSTFTVYLMMFAISIVNIAYGFLFESRKRTQMKEMFGQYVPPAHVEQMTESKKAYTFEGESRNMSVLFADIRNFTGISEKLSANNLKQLLNDYFTPMTKIVFDNNGTIDKYVGDMIMAFWGAPLENKNHALDAVKAGFAMLKAADTMGQEFAQMGADEIKIGIGINTGNMNVGDMGSKYRRSYTVLGDSVNLSSRLEAATKFYHVNFIISELTLSELHNEVFVRHLDRVKVKGKEQAVNIFQPICMRDEATEDLKNEIRLHGEALKYYYNAEWNKANEAFKALHEQYPDLYVYEMFLKRIPQLIADDIQADWDGCYVRNEK